MGTCSSITDDISFWVNQHLSSISSVTGGGGGGLGWAWGWVWVGVGWVGVGGLGGVGGVGVGWGCVCGCGGVCGVCVCVGGGGGGGGGGWGVGGVLIMWPPWQESRVYVPAMRSGAGQRNLKILSCGLILNRRTCSLVGFQLWHTWISPWQLCNLTEFRKKITWDFPCQEQSRSWNFERCDWPIFQILASWPVITGTGEISSEKVGWQERSI